MAKDAYWFRHDSNAATDPKMMRLTAKYGNAGYGAFWRVIEFIHSHCAGVLSRSDVEILASEFRYPELPDMIKDCCAWGLFTAHGDRIVSKRLNEELQLLADRKDAGKSAAHHRWHKNADLMAPQCVTHAPRNAQTEKTDREDREDRQTEKTDSDPNDVRKQDLSGGGVQRGRGDNSPPPAAPAGPTRPAGPPDVKKIAEIASQQLGPPAIPLDGLPGKLRIATERARLKVDADAKSKAEQAARKTADYHAVKQPTHPDQADEEFEDFEEAEP